MKILCIGDSLGLPRDGCTYEETWLNLLAKRYPQHTFFSHFEGGRLIDSAVNDFNMYYRYYRPDMVILQLGICDCSPRYVNDRKTINIAIRKVFSTLGLIKLYWKIVKSHPRRPDCVYTKPKVFKDKYKVLVDGIFENNCKSVIAIKIGHSNEAIVEKSSKYFNSNVDRYNSIIDKVAEEVNKNIHVVAPLDVVEDDMFVDGYHCSGKGMQKVFEVICEIIDKGI